MGYWGLCKLNDMKQYLTESNGQYSSVRLMFVIGMFWAMLVSTLLTVTQDWSAGEFVAVFAATSGVFVGLKLGQKPMEAK